MDYQIALSPDLGLSPADFAAAWNADPASRAVAEASVDRSASEQYDPFLIAGAVAVLSGVAVNIVSSVLYDLIKQTLAKRDVQKHVEIKEIERPDGSHVLIVTVDDE